MAPVPPPSDYATDVECKPFLKIKDHLIWNAEAFLYLMYMSIILSENIRRALFLFCCCAVL